MGDTETRRLIEVATRLFAELGFDGTSTRMIAEAAGVDVDEMVELVGDKTELYRTVMAHAYQTELEALRAAAAGFTPTLQGLYDLADAYLDFCLDHPEILSLWMHRWLGDAIDVDRLEDEFTRPMSGMVANLVRDLVPPDVDADYVIWTIVWSVYGFLTGGAKHAAAADPAARITGSGRRPDPAALARFRAHLRTLIRRMTAPEPGRPA
jgi:Transcriptional regulator